MKKLIIVLCFVALFISACNTETGENKKENEKVIETVTMPDLIGKNEKEAIEILEKNNIQYYCSNTYSEEYDKEIVCQQSIAAGEEYDNSKVKIEVSDGLAVKVPKLEGKKYDEELKKVLENLKVNIKYNYSNVYEKDYICKSDVTVEKLVPVGGEVNIEVCVKKYNNLDVVGNNLKKSKKIFKGSTIKKEYRLSEEKAGTVLEFSTEAGESKKAINVKLVLSDGNAVKVPDVEDISESKAIKKLNKKGIKYKIKYDYDSMTCGADGSGAEVDDQSADGLVDKNKPIILTVCKPAIKLTKVDWELNSLNGVEVDLGISNLSDKKIAKILFEVDFYDRVGDPAECSIRHTNRANLKFVGPLNAFASDTCHWDAVIYNSATAVLKPISAKVFFVDGEEITLEYTGMYWHSKDFYGGKLND